MSRRLELAGYVKELFVAGPYVEEGADVTFRVDGAGSLG